MKNSYNIKFLSFVIFLSVYLNSFSQQFLSEGIELIESSKYDLALKFFKQKDEDLRKSTHDTNYAFLQIYLGKSYQLTYQYDSALFYFTQGLDLFTLFENKNGEMFSLISLAEYYRNLQQYQKALDRIVKAEKIAEQNKVKLEYLAYLYNRYAAIISESTGDKKLVIRYSKKVIKYAEQINDLNLLASSYNELGFIYEKNQNDSSLVYYQMALKIYQNLNNLRYQVNVLNNIARTHYNLNEYAECVKFTKVGIELSKNTDWYSVIDDLYFHQFNAYKALNKFEKAILSMQKFHEASMLEKKAEWDNSLAEMETKYELSEKERLIEESKKESLIIQKENDIKTNQRNYLVMIGAFLMVLVIVLYLSYKKIKNINSELQESLHQKDVLLKEVHHRVKNNMQMVSSLLEMQLDYVNDKKAERIIKEGNDRIKALSFAHQNLYLEEDYTNIRLKDYLELVINNLLKNTNIESYINIPSEKVIDIEKTQAIGFVVNELITNSLKYGFDDFNNDVNNKISIEYTSKPNFCQLVYYDNGVGFPNNFDLNLSNTLGSILIKSFVERKLKGKIETKNDNGAISIISFPR